MASAERIEREARGMHKVLLSMEETKSLAGGDDFEKLDDKKKAFLGELARKVGAAANRGFQDEAEPPLPGDRPATKEVMKQVNTAVTPEDQREKDDKDDDKAGDKGAKPKGEASHAHPPQSHRK